MGALMPLAFLVGGGRRVPDDLELAPLLRLSGTRVDVRKLGLTRSLRLSKRAQSRAVYLVLVQVVQVSGEEDRSERSYGFGYVWAPGRVKPDRITVPFLCTCFHSPLTSEVPD